MSIDQQINHARNEIAGLKRLIRIGRNASDYAAILARHRQNLKLLLARKFELPTEAADQPAT